MSLSENTLAPVNTEHPLLSVVIPTHGRPGSIREVLHSLLSQDLSKENFEILIVANLPDADLTSWIAGLHAAGHTHVHELVSGKLGVNSARNVGLRNVRAPVALFLDDDCSLPDPQYLTRLLKIHSEQPDVLGLGGAYLSPPGLNAAGVHYNWISNHWLDARFEGPFETTKLIGGAVSYKMTLLHGRGLEYDELIRYGGAETEFHERLIEENFKLVYHPALSVIHKPDIGGFDLVRKAHLQGFAKARRGGEGVHRETFWKVLLKNTLYQELYRGSFNVGEKRGRIEGAKPLGFFGLLGVYLFFFCWHGLRQSQVNHLLLAVYWKLHAVYWFGYRIVWKTTELYWVLKEIYWRLREVYWFFYRIVYGTYGLIRRALGFAKAKLIWFYWQIVYPKSCNALGVVRQLAVQAYWGTKSKISNVYWSIYPIIYNFKINWRHPKTFRDVKMPLPFPALETLPGPLWIGSIDRSWTADERHRALRDYSRLGVGSVEVRDESYSEELRQFGLESRVFIRPFARFDFMQTSFVTEKIVEIRVSEINRKSAPLLNWVRALELDFALHFVIDAKLQKRAAQVFFEPLLKMNRIKAFSHEMPRPSVIKSEYGFENFQNLHAFDLLTRGYEFPWRSLYRYNSDSRFLYQHQPELENNPFAEVTALAPKISVIIPHHRDYAHLVHVLRCLRDQSLAKADYEVIVVDNATGDHLLTADQRECVLETAREMCFSLLTLRSESFTHFLSGHARTQGFLKSRGGVVLYLDSDILTPTNFLEAILDRMQTADVVMAKRKMLVDDFDAAVTDLDDVRADQTYLEGEYWEGYKKAAAWSDLNDYWK
jgi:glycosyltransferase involved in cell wall biosynthesis